MNKTLSEAWRMIAQTADESFNEVSERRLGEKEKEGATLDDKMNKLYVMLEKLVIANQPQKKKKKKTHKAALQSLPSRKSASDKGLPNLVCGIRRRQCSR